MADGEGCICGAYGESECGCDADWTPQELIDARAEIEWLRSALLGVRCLPVAMLKTGDAGEVVGMRHQPADRLWPNALIPLYMAPTLTDDEAAAIECCATLAGKHGDERAAAVLRLFLDRVTGNKGEGYESAGQ